MLDWTTWLTCAAVESTKLSWIPLRRLIRLIWICYRQIYTIWYEWTFGQGRPSPKPITDVDLSKILGGQQNIMGGQNVLKSDKYMGISQLLGGLARAAPKVYACEANDAYCTFRSVSTKFINFPSPISMLAMDFAPLLLGRTKLL